MKKFLRYTLMLVLTSVILTTNLPVTVLAENLQTQINNKNTSENKDGEVIIMYKQSTTDNRIKSKSLINPSSFLDGLTVEKTVTFEDVENNNNNLLRTNSVLQSDKTTDYVVSLVKSEKYSTDELINKLSKENSIMYVQKNYKVKAANITNDTYQKYQWAIENIGQNAGTQGLDINPEKVTKKLSDEKVIVVLDTGVDYTNSELKNHIWTNPFASKGLLKGEHGYDFYDSDEDPMDEEGHGTHVAGIITAESNNNEGITGAILNNSNIKIMPIRLLGPMDGTAYNVILAYHYIYRAQKLGVNVVAINNSWGGKADMNDNIMKTAFDLVGKGPNEDGNGALSICAAGNEYSNTDKVFNIPSCLDSNYIISVAASNEKDEIAGFSNYGISTVDIAAPGTNVLSTVSYNCFNPSLYEDKSRFCSQYVDFDSGLGDFKYRISEGKVTTSSNTYFGNSGQSFNWQFDAVKDKVYELLIPCTAENDDQKISQMLKVTSNVNHSGEYYINYDFSDYEDISLETQKNMKNIANSEDENYWTHIEEYVSKGGTIRFLYYALEDSKVNVYIDDFAISKSGVNEDDFGKYDFYNGTSMATPYVTSAVGISSNYKNETALQRKQRILGTIRKVNSLNNKVATSGVLDLEYLSNPNIFINSAKINTNGEVTIKVNNMNKMPKVFVNNKEVTATKVNSDTLKVTNKNLINTTARITLKITEKNTDSKTFYLKAGKNYNFENSVYGINSLNSLFTNGKDIYSYLPQTKTLIRLDKEDEIGFFNTDIAYLTDESMQALLGEQYKIMGNEYKVENTDFVFINNNIYTIFTFDYGFAKDKVLAYYNINKGDYIWRKAKSLPTGINNLSMTTLGAYNGNLYVIGGYNDISNKISKKVYKLDMTTKKWSYVADLPEGRFASKATQVGNKLLLSFGGQENSKVPSVLIFDGKNWKKSSATIDLKDYTGSYNNIKYFKPETGLISGGLILSGINAEKYGNTFYYDISTDIYKKSGYIINRDKDTVGIAVGNRYYIIDKDTDFGVIENEYEDETEVNYGEEYGLSVYSIPVKTGLSKLTVTYPSTGIKATINAKLYSKKAIDNKLTNTYYYMPGSTMNLNLSDKTGYYIRNFKVDGKEVNGYKYTNVIGADRTIQITTPKTTSLIKLNKTSANLSSFSKLKLTATLSDKEATSVKWATNNKNYATISTTGVITPKWAGNGKTVTITASSTIRGRKASVTSKINIKAPTINNLKAKTTKSSITLNWNAVTGADGYEVYAYNETAKKYVLYKKPKTNSVTGINLRAGTTYKLQVLAYKTIDKKKCVTARKPIICTTLKK